MKKIKKAVEKSISRKKRIATHVPGFDKSIGGGFIPNSVNLISGGPGSGKTIFGLQYIHEGIEKSNENGLIITFDENTKSLLADSMEFGWDFKKLEKKGKCIMLSFEPFKLRDIRAEIAALITRANIKRVILDSVSVFAMAFEDNSYQLRHELYRLSSFLKSLNCTVLLTAETDGEPSLDITAGGKTITRDGFMEYVADSVMTLHNSGIGGEADRAIRVVKMRRTNHRRDPIPMKICSKGIIVLSGEL